MKRKIQYFLETLLARPEAMWETTIAQQRLLPFVALALTILSGGISTIPRRSLKFLLSYANDPLGSQLFSTYHGETPLFFFLAHAIDATTLTRYLSLCFCLIVIAYLVVYLYGKNRQCPPALLVVLLFAQHPVAYVLNTWLGMMDGITVIATAILLFSRSTMITALISIVLTLNHTAAPFIAMPIIILRGLSRDSNIYIKHAASVAIGLLAGKMLLIWLNMDGAESASRLNYIMDVPLIHWVRINVTHFPLVLYSMCFALWIPVVLMIVFFFHNNRRLYVFYLLFMAGFYCITLVTKDTTRVFALLSWGPTLYCLMHTWRNEAPISTKAVIFRASVVACALLGWCMPRLVVWDGAVYAPGFEQPFRVIWRVLQGLAT